MLVLLPKHIIGSKNYDNYKYNIINTSQSRYWIYEKEKELHVSLRVKVDDNHAEYMTQARQKTKISHIKKMKIVQCMLAHPRTARRITRGKKTQNFAVHSY